MPAERAATTAAGQDGPVRFLPKHRRFTSCGAEFAAEGGSSALASVAGGAAWVGFSIPPTIGVGNSRQRGSSGGGGVGWEVARLSLFFTVNGRDWTKLERVVGFFCCENS